MGAYAMEANTTGESNVSIGVNALEDNTTASNNTAIGRFALRVNTTGANNNTGVGTNALACQYYRKLEFSFWIRHTRFKHSRRF